MNESEFENELRGLRPAAPSKALEHAIASELRHSAVPYPSAAILRRKDEGPFARLLFGLSWACSGAAVAVVAMVSFYALKANDSSVRPASGAEETVDPRLFESAESTRELLTAEESGLVYSDDQEPTRVIRYNSLERHVWANPVTGARVEVEVPREDVVLLPVAFQ